MAAETSTSNVKIYVGPDGSYIKELIQNGTIIPYLTDNETITLTTVNGEIKFGLSPIAWTRKVEVFRESQPTLSGVLENYDSKRVTLIQDDGTKVVTKYDSINFKDYVGSPNSYGIWFNPQHNVEAPTILYFTDSINWTISFILDISTRNLTESAVITSSRGEPIEAELIMISIDKPEKQHSYVRSAITSSSLPMASSSGAAEEGFAQFLVKNLGVQTLNQTLRVPTKISKNIKGLKSVSYVDIDFWNANKYGFAVKGYTFKAPFSLPPSVVQIREGSIITDHKIKGYQVDEDVIIKTYFNVETNYSSSIFIASKETPYQFRQYTGFYHEASLTILINRLASDSEIVVIGLDLGNLNTLQIEPKPAEKREGSKIFWTAGVQPNKETKLVINIAYMTETSQILQI